jgi:pyruvate formate lyase activating enzyme
MIIGGLEKLTLLDYPNHLAAIVFTRGCNFRCHFCYNPGLVWPQPEKDKENIKKEKGLLPPSVDDLFLFLKKRIGRLEGVVITGGEPTLHADLPEFIKTIKDMGYLVKLDSNGTNPLMLEKLIKLSLIDYIAMDIKATPAKYEKVAGVPVNYNNLKKSVKIIMNSGLSYEFRTTVVPGLLLRDDFDIMGQEIKGADKWYLQSFKSDIDLVDMEYKAQAAYTAQEMTDFAKIGSKYVKLCVVRQ